SSSRNRAYHSRPSRNSSSGAMASSFIASDCPFGGLLAGHRFLDLRDDVVSEAAESAAQESVIQTVRDDLGILSRVDSRVQPFVAADVVDRPLGTDLLAEELARDRAGLDSIFHLSLLV